MSYFLLMLWLVPILMTWHDHGYRLDKDGVVIFFPIIWTVLYFLILGAICFIARGMPQ